MKLKDCELAPSLSFSFPFVTAVEVQSTAKSPFDPPEAGDEDDV
jgi:hypothetical protein